MVSCEPVGVEESSGLAHLVLERRGPLTLAVCRHVGRAQSPLSLYFLNLRVFKRVPRKPDICGIWVKTAIWEIRPGPDRYHTAAVPSGFPPPQASPITAGSESSSRVLFPPCGRATRRDLAGGSGLSGRATWVCLALALNRASEASAEALSLFVDFFLFNCDDFELLPT